MNERIMEAVREIEGIRDAMGKDYQWENATGEMVENWQYFDEDDTPEESVPKERAIKDRAKMLDVLRHFYRTYAVDFYGMDDFVTLFGVYCNHYIRFNLHRAIPNEDYFGISALWDTVTDVKLQEYLCLLQQGIFKGFDEFLNGTNYFLKADDMFSESYSLPNLYMFIYFTKVWLKCEEDDKQSIEEIMLVCLEDMSNGLRDYCCGSSPFLRPVKYGGEDQNPLPYIRYCNMNEHRATSLAIKMSDAILTIKEKLEKGVKNNRFDETYDEVFNELDFRMALYNAVEGANGVKDLRSDMDSDKIEFVPQEWRDEDGIIYRLNFLSIPCLLDWGENVFSFLTNLMLDHQSAIREKETIQQEKDEIVQDFSHTYQNMRATSLYNMAKKLLNKPDAEDRKLGRTALLEYTRKETLTKDVYMMKLKYERNTEKLRSILRQSCTYPSPETHMIHNVLHQAILMCLVNAFYDQGTENSRRMRSHLKDLWSDWKETILDFEKSIIFQGEDCLIWLREHDIQLYVAEGVDWQSIGFFQNGYAAVMLRNILTELLVNMFKYGGLRQSIYLTFATNGQAITIEMENYLPDGKHETSNSQVGIHSMAKMLHVLWGEEPEEGNERLTATYEGGKFYICLSLPKAVFSAKGAAK